MAIDPDQQYRIRGSTLLTMTAALVDAKRELAMFSDDAQCDHNVGICWCSYWHVIERLDRLIENPLEPTGESR